MSESFLRRNKSIFILAAVFLAAPFVLPYPALANEVILFALAAVAFDLCVGFTGVMMFSQAAFFGAGLYATAIFLVHTKGNIFLAMGLGVAASAIVSAIVGFMASMRSGSYSVLLTLAFNELMYFITFQWSSLTGGDDGLTGVKRPDLNLFGYTVDLQSSEAFYFFCFVFFIISFIVIRMISNSPFGRVLLSIRENEKRAGAIGYNVRLYKTLVFIIAGIFMGLSGSLYAMYIQFAHTHYVQFQTSGNIVMMVLIGGMGTLFGPVVGAFLIVLASDLLSAAWDRWMLIMGLLFVFFVLFARGGIWSLVDKAYLRIFRKKGATVGGAGD